MAEKESDESGGGSSGSDSKGPNAAGRSAKTGAARRSRETNARGSAAKATGTGKAGARNVRGAAKGAKPAARSGTGRRAAKPRETAAQRREREVAEAARFTAAAVTGPAEELTSKDLAAFRDALARNLQGPLNLVVLSRERIDEVVGDAVQRGRMTASDAQDLVQGLLARGRRQTGEMLGDLEGLLERGRGEVGSRAEDARGLASETAERARRQVEDARARAVKGADPVIVQADRARRTLGVGPSFPILGYDELTAAQVQARLGPLTPPELRKVRDHERRNANRKSVLGAIEAKLS